MKLSAEQLQQLVTEIICRAGSDRAEAEVVSEHLVNANLAGHDSHGVGMLPVYIDHVLNDLLQPNKSAKLIRDDGAIMVYDGQWGYGQRVAKEAMSGAIERCDQTGIVLMALRQAHHIGRIGTYGEQSVAAGKVSLHFVNVTDHNPLVAAFGGSEARFVTNPICIAMPGTANTEAVILDMATSRIAAGKVRVAMNRDEKISAGVLIDHRGQPTDDPKVIFHEPKGALLPFGEHKGYGLALFCELLAGALGGGGTIQPGNPRRFSIINNMLTFIIDPLRLVDKQWLQMEIDALIDYVKSSRPAAADRPVLVAGDPERIARALRSREGITIDPATWEQLLVAGESVGLSRAEARAVLERG